VDTIVIAGMGGKLIMDILSAKPETVQTLKQMVLQPQLNVCEVREYIHSIGFCIENEEMLIEDNKYYTIISAIPGQEKYNSKIEYMLGKILIERKNPVLKKYLEMNIDKYAIIIKELSNNTTVSSVQRKEILLEEMKALEEVYNCW
jgi:tRNA (adenine22-N1)-methyltransferase